MSNLLSSSPALSGAVTPPALSMRDFGDSFSTRKSIYDKVLSAASSLGPTQNARHTLKLVNPHYEDKEDYSIDDQKKAILEGRSLSRRLRGTWELHDNTSGALLGTRTQTVARVPYLTDRGTFIHNGNEYTLGNQMRLQPGIFTRTKENGEIESHINVMPGNGMSHHYFLDPAKGVFYAKIRQAKIPLLPLLKAMGAQDAQLREAWGDDIYADNLRRDDTTALNKFVARLVKKIDPNADHETQRAALREAVGAMKLDPNVTQRTLGQPYDSLNLDAMLATTKKLLAVSRGQQDPDDRDHLAFQTVYGPEDLFAERITKDYGGVRRGLLHKLSFQGNLDRMPSNALGRQLESALLHSGLGQALEEINPADVFDKQSRISRLGEGGIPSIDSVPDEARNVQPSHFGFIDPVKTPESFRVGIDSNLARSVRKGSDGKIYAPFKDTRTGEVVWKSPQDLSDAVVGFPDTFKTFGVKHAPAMRKGQVRPTRRRDIGLQLQHFENAFTSLGNLIPMKSQVKGQRVSMGSRMMTQALPLTDAESPLVQTGIPGSDKSFEEEYAKYMGAIKADRPGRVLAVDDSNHTMRVRFDDGEEKDVQLYNHFPYNRKTFIHNTPALGNGETFQAGQTLATSNYTDKSGTTALGKNFRVAYIPFRGMNFEDANIISQSAANRMASEHMYQHRMDWGDQHRKGLSAFKSLFPSKFDRATLGKVDTDGIVKPGTVVNFGDPLILAAQQSSTAKNRVHRQGSKAFNDVSETWTHHAPGIVTDVLKGDRGTTVLVKSVMAMQIGDKMSGRYGDKGIVSDIVPDDQMPRDRDGQPFEVLLNPLGIITRTNPAQVVEAVLGKIASKTGKPYKIQDFEDIQDLVEFAIAESQKHGIKDQEDLIDAETGKSIPNILTGNRFFMKLHHTAEGKGQGRGTGGYTNEGSPAKGGLEGSKRISVMDTNALLSHGATQVLRDASNIRGQNNPEFWLSFMQGHRPAEPREPLVYKKFLNELRGSGINVVPQGRSLNIMAMVDKDIDHLAGDREITSGETVRFDEDMTPVAGGLFDPALTGGHNGNRWSYIRLPEPMPNPVMEDPIRHLLGLTEKKMRDVLAGRESIQINSEGGTGTGPHAVAQALGSINLDRELASARAQFHSGRKSTRDDAARRLRYLKNTKQLGMHPKDWMLTKVPVLPPIFRPVSVMEGSGTPLVADANYLYKELLDANDNLNHMKDQVDDVGDERLAVYDAFKSVTGLGDPLHPKLQEKGVKGILKHIFGSSPKFGTVQRRLISTTVDVVGRGVIAPDPDLDMDSVGLPESRAWDIYRPFVVRRLRRQGLPMNEANRHVEDHTALARKEILAEMAERPVFVNRAPVLHRFGIMAFWPRLVKGDTVKVSPLIVKGFGADFDGDAVQYHVPVDDSARDEAIERMMPSKNLLSPADFKSPVHAPTNEYLGGLWRAVQKAREGARPQQFANTRAVLAAWQRGDIDVDSPVEIYEEG